MDNERIEYLRDSQYGPVSRIIRNGKDITASWAFNVAADSIEALMNQAVYREDQVRDIEMKEIM